MTQTGISRGQAARERLITAAQELFWENGVAATTPRQVLARSGVGHGSLYHHFPTKRALAIAAIQRTSEQALARALAVLNQDRPARERLRAFLTRQRDALAGCRIGRLTADPDVMADAEMREPIRRYFTALVEALATVIAETGVPLTTATARATTVAAVVQGGYVLARAGGDAHALERATSGLMDLLEGD
ncbi:TetR/AcrR family transcriptional regulator [Natronoglycomyces albus]|uniref:TetR/AcrR family transcriptional regulator n=1 Tax=Natronoglycomyces albus TaxID=2811108 RepID=A0A895XVG8_9ACTN|nr:TetR/AcrR family transcriptional regulator [Natronoglycomyces albus]QSB05638.1 TetR/AcrR family transcriptional regulator [Natronoglycomyces albus]